MPLLDESTNVWRSVLAQPLPDGTFRIVADQPYDPGNERWQFPPGSVAHCRERFFSSGERHLAAFVLVQPSMPSA